MTLNKSTLSEQIYEILRSDILSQKIKLGEKLTLKTLKERFDVSSTPIRDALTRLTEDGLVKYYSNIGVNVIELTEKDIIELYQFMGDLDSLAILYSSKSENMTEILKELQAVISVTDKLDPISLSSQKDIDRWIECSDRFHLIFYDYCDNSRLKLSAQKLRSQLTIFSNMYETEIESQKIINEMHGKIYQAYSAGDYAKAAKLMKEHLNTSLQYALDYLKKINL